MLHVAITAVLHNQALKPLPRQQFHELRKDELAGAHRALPKVSEPSDSPICQLKSWTPTKRYFSEVHQLLTSHDRNFNRTLLAPSPNY
ncbi:hypothetical protein D3C83_80850 [compost metagenome]